MCNCLDDFAYFLKFGTMKVEVPRPQAQTSPTSRSIEELMEVYQRAASQHMSAQLDEYALVNERAWGQLMQPNWYTNHT